MVMLNDKGIDEYSDEYRGLKIKEKRIKVKNHDQRSGLNSANFRT